MDLLTSELFNPELGLTLEENLKRLSRAPFFINYNREGDLVSLSASKKIPRIPKTLKLNPCRNFANGTIFDIKEKKLVAYSFPTVRLMSDYHFNRINTCTEHNYAVQVLIDGSIMKIYYWNGEWRISTNNLVNAMTAKWAGGISFGEMMKEAMTNENLRFEDLNPEWSYTFTMWHPKNLNVVHYVEAGLQFLSAYNNQTGEFVLQRAEVHPATSKMPKSLFLDTIMLEADQFGEMVEKTIVAKNKKRDLPLTPDQILGFVVIDCKTNERYLYKSYEFNMALSLHGNYQDRTFNAFRLLAQSNYSMHGSAKHNKLFWFCKYYPNEAELVKKTYEAFKTFINNIKAGLENGTMVDQKLSGLMKNGKISKTQLITNLATRDVEEVYKMFSLKG